MGVRSACPVHNEAKLKLELKAGKGLLQGHVKGWVAHAPKPQISGFSKAFLKAP